MKLWSDFHQVRMEPSGPLHSAYQELLQSLDITELQSDPLFIQSLYSEVFTLLVSEHFNNSQSARCSGLSSSSRPVELTEDELNAMRYACGYVSRSLLKKYENKAGDVYSQYVQCLSEMAFEDEGDSIFAYTRMWFDQVNRGCLFPLNDATFIFFIEVEKCVQVLLPNHVIRSDSEKATFQKTVIDAVVKNECPVSLDVSISRYRQHGTF